MAATESGRQDSGASGRIAEIPLFPLNIVMFPQMILPLHIFEERYKEMINRCVHESQPFGIVLVSEVDAATNRVETFLVGCTARVERVERLPDGCMNIQVVGEERFRLLDTHERMPYRTGLAEFFEDDPNASEATFALTDEVQKLLRDFFTRYLSMVGHPLNEDDDFDLPDGPTLLSFVAARALPVSNEEKQELLAERDVTARLTVEREALLRAVTRLRRAEETQQIVWRPVDSQSFAAYHCDN